MKLSDEELAGYTDLTHKNIDRLKATIEADRKRIAELEGMNDKQYLRIAELELLLEEDSRDDQSPRTFGVTELEKKVKSPTEIHEAIDDYVKTVLRAWRRRNR